MITRLTNAVKVAAQILLKLLGLLLIAIVKVYQICLSPLLPPACRFYPSCSKYFILAVRKFGPIRGTFKGIHRICRCHPWNPGGYDPP